jgi:hypothetical protein
MQREFAQVLRNQCDQTGVVRTRRHFAEPHLVAFHEQLHPEQTPAAQIVGDRLRDLL